jgi:hypothetical protein
VGYGTASDGAATCPSRLWTRPFALGLPEEFASAVLDALLVDDMLWPAGVLWVDRAGFDEIESSTMVFGWAAGALACVLARDPEEHRCRSRDSRLGDDVVKHRSRATGCGGMRQP